MTQKVTLGRTNEVDPQETKKKNEEGNQWPCFQRNRIERFTFLNTTHAEMLMKIKRSNVHEVFDLKRGYMMLVRRLIRVKKVLCYLDFGKKNTLKVIHHLVSKTMALEA